MRYTLQQNNVVERINRTLLEKVWFMLFNVGLDKRFRAEAMNYANHLLNWLLGGKTSMKMWSRKHAQYSIHVFWCLAYYHIKNDKFDPHAKNAIFVQEILSSYD